MGVCSKTSRDAIGSSDWDRIMRGRPHAQERAKALIKSGVQMMRQSSKPPGQPIGVNVHCTQHPIREQLLSSKSSHKL
ncbi:hypothetical protein TNCV_4567561 [Trichonephila clavipes]|nr:hypothetical protein TNCV_4567561 [Trichonephila clavipes]